MMDIVHPVQMSIVGRFWHGENKGNQVLFLFESHSSIAAPVTHLKRSLFRMSEVLEHLESELMKQFIYKIGHRFLSLKLAGEKSRNNEHSLSVAKAWEPEMLPQLK